MKKYNGHRSWAAWNVSLWLFNDENLYNIVKQAVKYSRTKDIAAKRILAELGGPGTKTPDGANYTLTSIRLAIAD